MGNAAPSCPTCSRPVAVARAACLYCGAALSADAVISAEASAARVASTRGFGDLARDAPGAPRQDARSCLVIRTSAAHPDALARAFSISTWEAQQWRARGSHRLVRVAKTDAARAEESALRAAGIEAWALPEADTRAALDPWVVEEIDLSAAAPVFTGRPAHGGTEERRAIAPDEVALVLSGPILRQRLKPTTTLKRPGLDRLDDGYRAHLHLSAAAPIEFDPRRVSVLGGAGAPAVAIVRDLVKRFAAAAHHDENFRNEVPVMSESDERPDELAPKSGRGAETARAEPRAVILDNARQFRSYSGWRGAVERASREPLRTAS